LPLKFNPLPKLNLIGESIVESTVAIKSGLIGAVKFNSAGFNPLPRLGSIEKSLANSTKAAKSGLAGALKFNSAKEFQSNSARALESRSSLALAGLSKIIYQASDGWQFAFMEAGHIASSILPGGLESVNRFKDKALGLAGFSATGRGNYVTPDSSGLVLGEAEQAADTTTPLSGPLISGQAPAAATAATASDLASLRAGVKISTSRQMEILALLTDKNGKIVDGEYEVRFALYNKDRAAADAYPSNTDQASKVWEETQRVAIKNGALRTFLGLTKDLPLLTLLAVDQYYLGIRVAGDSEMIPRKKNTGAVLRF